MAKITILAKLIGKNFFTVSTNTKTYTIQRENGLYEKGIALLKAAKYPELLDLLDKPQALAKHSFGKVKVYDGEIRYNDKVVSGYLAEQILAMITDRIPFEPLVKFLNNVMENPCTYVQEDLYKFLEHGNMPITDDGHFLAYKYVKHDFTDAHSGKYDNSVGKVVSMKREDVVNDRSQCCAAGLHVGVLQYVQGHQGSNKVVIVKVNPKDIVSIPTSYNFQKMRTCRYEVIGEYEAPLADPVMIDATTPYASEDQEERENFGDDDITLDFKAPIDEGDTEEVLPEVKTELEGIEEYVKRGDGFKRTLKQIQGRCRRQGYTLDEIVDIIDSSENLALFPINDLGRKHWQVEFIG